MRLKHELNNPTCGDVIELDVAIEDGVIKDIAFQEVAVPSVPQVLV